MDLSRLQAVQQGCRDLQALLDADQKKRLARHQDEKPAIEQLINSLQQSLEILKKEKKRLKDELQDALSKAEKLAKSAQGPGNAKSPATAAAERGDVVDLQTKLIDLNNRLLDTDFELQKVTNELQACHRQDELELLSTKIVVMQDTKRILQSEIDALRSNIFKIETAQQAEADKKTAEETGHAALGRVEEQMNRISTRIDRAKQQLYFPAAKGFRFSTGAGGVYMAAQDLFLSEVSGRIIMTAEKVTRSDGVVAARLSVTVEGANSSRDWAEGSGRRSAAAAGVGSARMRSGYSTHSASPAHSGPATPVAAARAASAAQAAAHLQPRSDGGASHASETILLPPDTTGLASSAGSRPLPTRPSADPFPNPQQPQQPSLKETASAPTELQLPPQSSTPLEDSLGLSGPSLGAWNAQPAQSAGSTGQGDQPVTVAGSSQSCPPSTGGGQQAVSVDTAAPQSIGPQSIETGSQSTGPQLTGTGPQLAGPQSTGTGVDLHVPARAAAQPAPASPVNKSLPPIATRLSKRPSQDAAARAAAAAAVAPPGLSGRPSGQSDAGSRKGDMISGFLSSISKRKDKLKDIVAGKEGTSSQSNVPSGSPSAQSSAGGAQEPPPGLLSGDQDAAGPSGRLNARMGRFREGLGARMERVREGLGERMDKVKEGIGELKIGDKMEKMRDNISEGLHDGRGKLSRLATAVTNKGRGGTDQHLTGDRALETRSVGATTGNDSTRGAQGDSLASTSVGSRLSGGAHTEPSGLTHPQPRSATHSTSGATAHNGSTTHPHTIPHSVSTATLPRNTHTKHSHDHHVRRSSTEAALPHTAGDAAQGAPRPPPPPRAGDAHGAVAQDGVLTGAALSVAFEEFGAQYATRKGLYVQLLGEGVQLIGERGTKVPDMTMSELMLEVEVSLTCVIEWTSLEGWTVPDARPLDLNILQLDHKMRGNSIPLPRTALKYMLNLFLPGVVTRLLLGSLPPEIGAYIVESGEPLVLSGELRVRGPALSTYTAPLHVPYLPRNSFTDPAKHVAWLKQAAAAARARQLLGLTELQAEVLHQLFAGSYSLLECPCPATLSELCRMAVAWSNSPLWSPLCNQWNKALQAMFDWYEAPPSERFNFMSFMQGSVARVVRKPVQVAFALDHVQVSVDVDAALNTAHDFLARAARDLHKKSARGDDSVSVPLEPLDVQLEALKLWHAALSGHLRTFKSRFRGAGCGLVITADREVFQFGAENVAYDGPMRLRIPLDVMLDPDHSFVLDVKLPGRDEYMSGVTKMLEEIMSSLSAVRTQALDGASQDGDSVAGDLTHTSHSQGGATHTHTRAEDPSVRGRRNSSTHQLHSHNSHNSHKETAAAYLDKWQDLVQQSAAELLDPSRVSAAGGGGGGGGMGGHVLWEGESSEVGSSRLGEGTGPLQVPLLDTPVVGQLALRKMAVSIRLDEERLAELLQTSAAMSSSAALSTLLGCCGELFSASVDLGWRPDQRRGAAEGATRPACMLTVANNEVTRVMMSLESLIFSSTVSPRVAVSVLASVVNSLMLRFFRRDAYQVLFWQRVFKQIHEYLSGDVLDVLMCLTARLETVKGELTNRLRLVAQGDPRLANSGQQPAPPPHPPTHAHSGSGGGIAAGPVPPVRILNEINLLTLLESYVLFSSAGEEGE